ncbi:MAG: DUF169 domain-containing protein [Deltaproteobacteria bacterium]|nr:DUF169 domain-containing protein [Deltaproteobacteria bacterium]
MAPDPSRILGRLGIQLPLIGFYDAPDAQGFDPVVAPEPKKHACVFSFFEDWLRGRTLLITRENFGCGGAGSALCSQTTRPREDFITFLVDTEGLKCSREVMGRWIDQRRTYRQEHPNLLIGPLRPGMERFLKTVTFYVNPDQMSALIIGAHYCHGPGDPAPVLAPFGSGCMELVTPFEDLFLPQAIIGATDIAMRQYLPPEILAFTVTVPMFEQLCGLDEKSFLHKPFLRKLQKTRAREGGH